MDDRVEVSMELHEKYSNRDLLLPGTPPVLPVLMSDNTLKTAIRADHVNVSILIREDLPDPTAFAQVSLYVGEAGFYAPFDVDGLERMTEQLKVAAEALKNVRGEQT